MRERLGRAAGTQAAGTHAADMRTLGTRTLRTREHLGHRPWMRERMSHIRPGNRPGRSRMQIRPSQALTNPTRHAPRPRVPPTGVRQRIYRSRTHATAANAELCMRKPPESERPHAPIPAFAGREAKGHPFPRAQLAIHRRRAPRLHVDGPRGRRAAGRHGRGGGGAGLHPHTRRPQKRGAAGTQPTALARARSNQLERRCRLAARLHGHHDVYAMYPPSIADTACSV